MQGCIHCQPEVFTWWNRYIVIYGHIQVTLYLSCLLRLGEGNPLGDARLGRLVGALPELLVVDRLLGQVQNLCGERHFRLRRAAGSTPRHRTLFLLSPLSTASVAAAASTVASAKVCGGLSTRLPT